MFSRVQAGSFRRAGNQSINQLRIKASSTRHSGKVAPDCAHETVCVCVL